MSGKKLRTKTTRKTKLWSDFGNHVSKPLGVLLMVSYPYAAIVFYSLSLYFSIQHNHAHLKRIEAKAKKQGKTLNLSMKAWTMFTRLGFDILGLGLSIILLMMNIWFASMIGKSFGESLLLVAHIGMTASSVASTFHKGRRLWKGDYDWTWGDVGRAVFGVAGTVFFACVIFKVIPTALLTNPLYLLGGVIVLGIMGLFKMKSAIEAGRETSHLLEGLNNAPKNNLGEFIKVSQQNLIALQELGYVDFDVLLDQVIEDITDLTQQNKTAAQEYKMDIAQFYKKFGRAYSIREQQQSDFDFHPSPPPSPRWTVKYSERSPESHPLLKEMDATQTDKQLLSPSLESKSNLQFE